MFRSPFVASYRLKFHLDKVNLRVNIITNAENIILQDSIRPKSH